MSKRIEMKAKLLKEDEMVEYWNNLTPRINKSVFFVREDKDGLLLSDRIYNALVWCHYKDEEKNIDWIKLF